MKRLYPDRKRWLSYLPLVAALLCIVCPPIASAATLYGTIGLTGEDGRFIPGQMIRIYLVTEEIPFDFADDPQLNRLERIVRINNAHIDFFKKYREKASLTGYLKTVAESSTAGTFVFADLAPGRYFVLVTFPSMIDGRKVAWQVPVILAESPYHWIHLNDENLLLPALAR
ncbi:MAG: hypothetical protein PVG78_15120 [Desulfobacterales bacterium]|jgi:hypothetical protein